MYRRSTAVLGCVLTCLCGATRAVDEAGAQAPAVQGTAPAPQQPPSPQQRVAMQKQWLQASQAQLHDYEWGAAAVSKSSA